MPGNQRSHLCRGLSQKKHSLAQIGAALGYSKTWAHKWITRYQHLGLQGLFDASRAGRPSKLSGVQTSILIDRLHAGPRPEDRVSVFRGWSIKSFIETVLGATYSLSGVYALLHRLNIKRIRPRPRHEKNDKERMKQWREETLPNKIKEVSAEYPNKTIEIWYQDEMRYGQKTRMTYEWRLSGTRGEQIKQLGFENTYIFGAVHPASGKHVGLVMNGCNSEVMNIHLSLMSQAVGENSHAILVMDCAGWHSRSTELVIPQNISILDLPPYSPELNPIERVWKWLKDNFLSHRFIGKEENLTEVGCAAWNQLTHEHVKSICGTA